MKVFVLYTWAGIFPGLVTEGVVTSKSVADAYVKLDPEAHTYKEFYLDNVEF